MPQREGDRIVETANEARGGVTGHGVRYVLAFGIVSCAVLFLAIYLYFFT